MKIIESIRRGVIAGVALAILLALGPAAAGAAPRPQPQPPISRVTGCDELIIDTPLWSEFVDGTEQEFGDHWRVARWDDRGQNDGTCRYAVDKAIQVVQNGFNGGPFPWGTCGYSQDGGEGVRIEPFLVADCVVVQHYRHKGKRRTRLWYFEVIPDQAYAQHAD